MQLDPVPRCLPQIRLGACASPAHDIGALSLLRRLRPDLKTIADFRRDNHDAFREVFRAFVQVCRALDLYGREWVVVDETCIKAVNNRDRNFTRNKLGSELARIDKALARYLERMNEADAEEGGGGAAADPRLKEKIASMLQRKERLEGHREALQASGDAQLSLTDSDARSMRPGPQTANVD